MQDRKVNAMLRKKKKELAAVDKTTKLRIVKGRLVCTNQLGLKDREYYVNSNYEVVETAQADMETF